MSKKSVPFKGADFFMCENGDIWTINARMSAKSARKVVEKRSQRPNGVHKSSFGRRETARLLIHKARGVFS
ncbi:MULTISPECIES: hypothetical protein [Allobacillus]|uniref:Uncharacterized protein n=1 Tax=Allobacillus halotolerans TaxID=570278 RepID=A0ABS6GQL8_9BACI|nr:hypothetical protein [Allobacillus halotolerans]MBU6081405.1 hypothetical protein [Allobacillus halotolerans]TSJ61823.1 hypothetical protein FPQ10_12195 [Allobacillus sp. SKP2-8]